MGRHVDTSWYEVYLEGRTLTEASDSGHTSDPEIAGLLGIKPKTWARIKAAGRFLDNLTPSVEREQIGCGYAPLERLAKLWAITPGIAREHLKAVLSNQLKVQDLEALIRQHDDADIKEPSAARTRTPLGSAFFTRMEKYFDSSKLHPFDAYRGRVLRRKGTLGSPHGYYLYNNEGELLSLVLCIKSGGWRDPASIAREIYEHALAQRHTAPAIWLVFERDNVVLRRLAELSLYWGGSPYDDNGHWLWLAHFTETDHLRVLFEDYFTELIQKMHVGNGLINQNELFCSLEPLDEQPAPKPLPLRPIYDLPKPDGNRNRPYDQVVKKRIQSIGLAAGATDSELDDLLRVSFDL